MIYSKIYFLFVILLIVYSVTSSNGEDKVKRQFQRLKYRYNHPPAAENYETIPVAVVYDKVIDKASREQKPLSLNEQYNDTSELITKQEEEIQVKPIAKDEPVDPKTNTVDKIVASSVNTKKPEPKLIKVGLKIPVAIVYDEEPIVIKRVKSAGITRVRKLNRRKLISRPAKEIELDTSSKSPESITAITEKHEEVSTAKPQITKTQVVQKSRTIVQRRTSESKIEKLKPIVTSNNDAPHSSAKPQITKTNIEPSKPQAIRSRSEIDTTAPVIQNKTRTGSSETSPESTKPIKKNNREKDPVVPIIESENRVYSHNGQFVYSYEGGDGTKAFSKGELKTFKENRTGEAVEGGFSYTDKEGNDFRLSYTADENGYRPVGAHLPTPPPIPPAIARALAYLATKPTSETITEE